MSKANQPASQAYNKHHCIMKKKLVMQNVFDYFTFSASDKDITLTLCHVLRKCWFYSGIAYMVGWNKSRNLQSCAIKLTDFQMTCSHYKHSEALCLLSSLLLPWNYALIWHWRALDICELEKKLLLCLFIGANGEN